MAVPIYFPPRTRVHRAPRAAGVAMLLRGSFIRGLVSRLLAGLLDAVLAAERLDAARGIDEALGAGIKRMAFRANLDMKLFQSRARFKGVAACAGHDAAAVFGMDSSFHFYFYSRFSCGIGYHRRRSQTIIRFNRTICRTILPLLTFNVAALGAILITIGAIASAASPPAKGAPTTSAPSRTSASAFAPADQTRFAPIV